MILLALLAHPPEEADLYQDRHARYIRAQINGKEAIAGSRRLQHVASVCRKKDVFAGEGRPAGLVTGWNTRSIASRRRLISLGMP